MTGVLAEVLTALAAVAVALIRRAQLLTDREPSPYSGRHRKGNP